MSIKPFSKTRRGFSLPSSPVPLLLVGNGYLKLSCRKMDLFNVARHA